MDSKSWRHSAAAVIGLGIVIGLSACGGDDGGAQEPAPMIGALRAVNGITDSSGLTVTVARSTPPPLPPAADDPNPPPAPPPMLTPVAINANDIAFGSGSGINVLPSVYYHLNTAPTGGTASDTDYVPVFSNNISTVFTYGTTDSFGSFIVNQLSDIPLSANQFATMLVHDASVESQTAYTLCLQLTPVDTSGTVTVSKLIPASFGTATGTFSPTPSFVVPSSLYSVDIFTCNQNDDGSYARGTGVFNSGGNGLAFPLTGTRILQFAVLDATDSQISQYGSPVTLLLLDDKGGSTPLFDGQN